MHRTYRRGSYDENHIGDYWWERSAHRDIDMSTENTNYSPMAARPSTNPAVHRARLPRNCSMSGPAASTPEQKVDAKTKDERSFFQKALDALDLRRMILVIVDLAVAVGAPLFHSNFVLQAGVGVIAVNTFASVWLLERGSEEGKKPLTSPMRNSIAASFVVTYLVLVGWSAFLQGQTNLAPNGLTQVLISNFTILTGIVVGFYFGTDAIKQVARDRRPDASQVADHHERPEEANT